MLQISGGLIVLHSVNQNLGLFRKQSLLAVILSWFRDFPRTGKVEHIVAVSSGGISFSGSAEATVTRTVSTIEERLAEAEKRIDEVRGLVLSKSSELEQKIASTKSELSASIAIHEANIRGLSETVDHATVGGFKEQAFGVLLAIYGGLVAVFA